MMVITTQTRIDMETLKTVLIYIMIPAIITFIVIGIGSIPDDLTVSGMPCSKEF